MLWIATRLRESGGINRKDLQAMFDTSSAQSSVDLRTFGQMNPGAMRYDVRAKRYVLASADAIRSLPLTAAPAAQETEA
jgi:hypothetical protein